MHLHWFFCFVLETGSHYVDHAGLEPRDQALGLKAGTTTPGLGSSFSIETLCYSVAPREQRVEGLQLAYWYAGHMHIVIGILDFILQFSQQHGNPQKIDLNDPNSSHPGGIHCWLVRGGSLPWPGSFSLAQQHGAPSHQQSFLLSICLCLENVPGSGGLTLSESCLIHL